MKWYLLSTMKNVRSQRVCEKKCTTTPRSSFRRADGGLSGEVSEDRGGDFASRERGRLHNWDEHERTQYFEHYLGRSLQAFTLDSFDIQQAEQFQKDILINFKFSTPQYGQTRGPLMLVRPRVLGESSVSVEHKPPWMTFPIRQRST